MANVLVRDRDEDVLEQLKAAAKANGRSGRSLSVFVVDASVVIKTVHARQHLLSQLWA